MTKTATTALCFSMSKAVQVESEAGFWLPMIPAGLFKGIDGRVWNNSNPEAVVASFTKKRPFDVEHSTHIKAPQGDPAPAAGWILKVENRNGEIWGYIEWNGKGQSYIDSKEYAFYSPAFGRLEDGTVVTLESAGLTNDPNLDVPALNHKEETEMPLALVIRQALGLGENATEQDAVTAINSLNQEKTVALNRANTIDLDKAVPKETHQLALNRAQTAEAALKKIQDKEIEALVQSGVEAGKISPANKEMFIGMCRQEGGIEQFNKFIESAPQIATNSQTKPPKQPSKPTEGGELTAEEIALCTRMGVSQESWKANRHHKITY
ncbi:peptidase [Vibrio cholerae]